MDRWSGGAPRAQVGPIEEWLTEDHVRLDRLLRAAEGADGTVEVEAFAPFRKGLLRHIAMEEKVLLPFVKKAQGGRPWDRADELRRDHGRIASLLVPTPTAALCAELRTLLGEHNALEEGPAGLYATADALAGASANAVLEELTRYPEVPVAPHYDGPLLRVRATGPK